MSKNKRVVYQTPLYRIIEQDSDDEKFVAVLVVEKKDTLGGWNGMLLDFEEAMAVIEEYHKSQDN